MYLTGRVPAGAGGGACCLPCELDGCAPAVQDLAQGRQTGRFSALLVAIGMKIVTGQGPVDLFDCRGRAPLGCCTKRTHRDISCTWTPLYIYEASQGQTYLKGRGGGWLCTQTVIRSGPAMDAPKAEPSVLAKGVSSWHPCEIRRLPLDCRCNSGVNRQF